MYRKFNPEDRDIEPGDMVELDDKNYMVENLNVIKVLNLETGDVKYLENIFSIGNKAFVDVGNKAFVDVDYQHQTVVFNAGDPAFEIKKLLKPEIIQLLKFIRDHAYQVDNEMRYDYIDDHNRGNEIRSPDNVLILIEPKTDRPVINPYEMGEEHSSQFVTTYHKNSNAQSTNPFYLDKDDTLHLTRMSSGPTLYATTNRDLKTRLVNERLPYFIEEWILYYIPVSELDEFLRDL